MMTSSYSGLKKRGLINDCISDMLTRIRNATLAKKSIVYIPCTQLNLQIAQILEKEGFIQNFQVLRGPNPLKNVQLNTSNVSNSLPSVVSSNSTSTKKEEVISHLPNVNENIRNWDSTEKVNTLNKSCELQEILIRLKYRSKKIYNGKTKESCITNLKRLSKPGLRIYTNYKEIPRILGGTGLVILSTPQGLLTDREARSLKIGGELLCFVW